MGNQSRYLVFTIKFPIFKEPGGILIVLYELQKELYKVFLKGNQKPKAPIFFFFSSFSFPSSRPSSYMIYYFFTTHHELHRHYPEQLPWQTRPPP